MSGSSSPPLPQITVTNYDTVSKCLNWVEEHMTPDDNDIMTRLRLIHGLENEDEEEEEERSFNTEFWSETKKQLLTILELMAEVQSVKCYCQRPDCPFQNSSVMDCSVAVVSNGHVSPRSSPRTSPTVYRKDISYGGFEAMMKSEDVVYGSTSELDVRERVDPLSKSDGSIQFKRGTPVVRRKRTTAPNVFDTNQINHLQNRAARMRLASTVH